MSTFCKSIHDQVSGQSRRSHRLSAVFSDGQQAEVATVKSYPFLVVTAFVADWVPGSPARLAVVAGTADASKALARRRQDPARRIVLSMSDDGSYAPWVHP